MMLFIYLLFCLFSFAHGLTSKCEPSESWSWTPWFNHHAPTTKGEYELHSVLHSQHPNLVCSEPRSVSAINQAGVDMNQTHDMIVLRTYDIFCLNNYDPKYRQKICDDYSVRYCCPNKIDQATRDELREIFIDSNDDPMFQNKARVVQAKCGRVPRSSKPPVRPTNNILVTLFNAMLSRIINGDEARPNGWPWLVSIGVRYRGAAGNWLNRTHICGGTLISASHVLTAAHCVEQKIDDRYVPLTPSNPTLESFFILRIGVHDIRLTKDEEIYRAEKIFVHERFISSTFENDLAVIRLDRSVPSTDTTMPICFPSNNVSPGRSVTVAGWGTVAETARVHSNVLRQANVTVLPSVNCRVYRDVRFDPARQLCAAALDWSRDTCAGDSGGPLMYSESGNWVIGGITSYGYGCSKRGFPGVYVRTASYSSWIKQKMINQ